MKHKFASFIKEQGLISRGQKILLAVSGGMDSMAMLFLFKELDLETGVVHCNFGLRGEESDMDETFVREVALRQGYEFYSRSFDTLSFAQEKGISIQMAARDLRYAYFNEIAELNRYDLIATAHHLDDQAETFFINLARGTGIAGLHGIRNKKGNIIRPLMFAGRDEIEEYVSRNGIPFREDSSNSSLKYMRNRVRHELLPLMRELNPSFNQEMQDTVARLSETEEIFREYIERVREDLLVRDGDEYFIDIAWVMGLPGLKTFFFEIISGFGFNSDDASNILRAMEGGPGKAFYSKDWRLVIDRSKLIISAICPSDMDQDTFLVDKLTGRLERPVALNFSTHPISAYSIPSDSNIASLDLGKLDFPLEIRKWKDGDTFIPLGMNNHKKLSDFFIDNKYSLIQKERAWLLCSRGEIVWVIGDRIDNRFKITNETQVVLKVRVGE